MEGKNKVNRGDSLVRKMLVKKMTRGLGAKTTSDLGKGYYTTVHLLKKYDFSKFTILWA